MQSLNSISRLSLYGVFTDFERLGEKENKTECIENKALLNPVFSGAVLGFLGFVF